MTARKKNEELMEAAAAKAEVSGDCRETEASELEELTVEEAFDQLSEIVSKMDAPEVSLEESMQLYKQGVLLLDRCGRRLNQIEKELIILTEEGDMPDGYEE
jgi:exodeoxyribonuclease VII small subunit